MQEDPNVSDWQLQSFTLNNQGRSFYTPKPSKRPPLNPSRTDTYKRPVIDSNNELDLHQGMGVAHSETANKDVDKMVGQIARIAVEKIKSSPRIHFKELRDLIDIEFKDGKTRQRRSYDVLNILLAAGVI